MSPDENPAILLNPADSVAVALRSLKAGEAVGPDGPVAAEPIPRGHKIALRAIAEGETLALPPFGKARVSRQATAKGDEVLVLRLRRKDVADETD